MNKKNTFEDMVRVKREGVKEVEPSSVHVPPPVVKIKNEYVREDEALGQFEEIKFKKSNSSDSKYRLWVIAFLCLVGLFFAVSVLFWKATITVHPKIQQLVLNQSFLASKNPNVSDLSFELVVISGEESKNVSTGEEKEYNEVAEGVVVLYNMYNTTPQKLAINTRLEGSNGKIYKTKTATTIPTITFEGLPGTTEVGIYADQAGEEYNSPPLDFKIAGFKGTPKYESYYGRSKTDITGGLKGRLRTVSELDRVAGFGEIKKALKVKLYKKVSEQIPEGYVFYKDAVSFRVDEENVTPSALSTTSLVTKGTLSGVLFKESDLTQKIIKSVVSGYDGTENLYVKSITDLDFTFPAVENLFWDSEKINFSLKGDITLIWMVDGTEVTANVLGKSKTYFKEVLSKYPNIDSIDFSIRPFWKNTFPEDPKDIEMIIEYPQ